MFDEPREGIVVGVRSVVGFREHSLEPLRDGGKYVTTKTKRCTAYVVACDLRGLYKVPAECIESVEVLDELEEDDFDFDDDFDLDELEEEFAL
jgi:hypothetical protein